MTMRQEQIVVRKTATDVLRKILVAEYGADNVYQVGDSEFSVMVGESENGEPIYINYSPEVKNFQTHKTPRKIMYAYDAPQMAKEYQETQRQKAEQKAEIERKKKEKIEKDKARRKEMREKKGQ